MRHRLDHRVVDFIHRNINIVVAQYGAVERAVVDHHSVGTVDQHLDVVQRAASGQVHHLYGLVIKRIGDQQHLRLLGVGVRAVRNRHSAERLQIEVEG